MNLAELLTNEQKLEYLQKRQSRNLIGPTLFPMRTTSSLTWSSVKGSNADPIMGHVQAFNAEAKTAGRDGASKLSGKIPAIKEKIDLDEELYIKYKQNQGNQDIVRALFDDVGRMYDAIINRIEKIRLNALAFGEVSLNENGFIATVDYGVPDDHKETLTSTDMFSDTDNSNPIETIQGWADAVEDNTGVRPTRALTSRTVLNYILQNAKVRMMIFGDNGGSRVITKQMLDQLMNAMNLPIIATYDLQVRELQDNKTYDRVRFFPEDRMVLFPDGKLGDTLTGPTAEGLMNKNIVRSQNGVYVQQWEKEEPPAIWTKAAATKFPTFPYADSVFIGVVI